MIAGTFRSNNSVEGWYNAFTSRISINHPNVIKLSNKIRREQSKFEIDIVKIDQGHEMKTQKASYKKHDEHQVSAYNSPQLKQ